MAAVLTNQTTDTTSGATAVASSGSVQFIASGSFVGAIVLVEVSADGGGFAPVATFSGPGAVVVDLKAGTSWRVAMMNARTGTSVSVSAI